MIRNRSAANRGLCVGLALLAASAAVQALPAAGNQAVTTPGSGDLTMCRNWIVYQSCNTYHKIELPAQVAVGDDLALSFGSNNKDYTFHVTGILREGETCKLLSPDSDAKGQGERIDVTNCRPTDKPAADAH